MKELETVELNCICEPAKCCNPLTFFMLIDFYISRKKRHLSSETDSKVVPALQVDYVRSVMAGDHLREEEHMALETLLANVPQNQTAKSNSLEPTPSNTPQLSPATTPANKKNRLPIGTGNAVTFLGFVVRCSVHLNLE